MQERKNELDARVPRTGFAFGFSLALLCGLALCSCSGALGSTQTDAVAADDGKASGIYKGILASSGHSGYLKASLEADGSSDIVLDIVLDDAESVIYGEKSSDSTAAKSCYSFSEGSIELTICVSSSGVVDSDSTKLNIDGDEVGVVVEKESSKVGVALYEGSFDGSASGTWNFLIADTNIEGCFYFLGSNSFSGAVSGSSVTISASSMTAKGTISGDNVSGTWAYASSYSGNWSGAKRSGFTGESSSSGSDDGTGDSSSSATVATPSFSPSAGTYSSAQSVTIGCSTSGATIYYTTDGSMPTSSSTKYSGAIAVGSTTTIKAVAVASGKSNSAIATAIYTIGSGGGKVSPVYFSLTAGTYTSAQKVELICSTSGAAIYYTTDGATPTGSSTKYSSAISISKTTTIMAIATKSGMTDSDVSDATYKISPSTSTSSSSSSKVATPSFSPSAGAYSSAQSVTISCGTSGASVYYTTDGSTPSSSSTKYSSAVKIGATMTLKAIAIKSGMTNSSVKSGTYTIGSSSTTTTTTTTTSSTGTAIAAGGTATNSLSATGSSRVYTLSSFSGGTLAVHISSVGSGLMIKLVMKDSAGTAWSGYRTTAGKSLVVWGTGLASGSVTFTVSSLSGSGSYTIECNDIVTLSESEASEQGLSWSSTTGKTYGNYQGFIEFSNSSDHAFHIRQVYISSYSGTWGSDVSAGWQDSDGEGYSSEIGNVKVAAGASDVVGYQKINYAATSSSGAYSLTCSSVKVNFY